MRTVMQVSAAAAVALVLTTAPVRANSAPRITPAAVDVGGWITLSGVPADAGRATVTLRPVDGGRPVRIGMDRVAAASPTFSGRVRSVSGEYEVLVRAGHGEPVSAGRLTVLPPRVEWITPARSDAVTEEYIAAGRNFGRRRGQVLVDGVPARVTKWRNDVVQFRTPRPAAGAHDVELRSATAETVVPCGLVVREPNAAGAGLVLPATFGETPHDVWRLDWKPHQIGESSSHNTVGWLSSLTVYDPVRETLLFETQLSASLPAKGMYVMVSGGGEPPETSDETAEIFFDLGASPPRITVFAYKSRGVGDTTGNGWTDDPSKPSDVIEASGMDASFVLATEDRVEGPVRTCGFLIDVRNVNRHRPMYGRTDGSAWTGVRFGGPGGTNAGLWSYLYSDPMAAYDAEGRLSKWITPKWGTYPGEDGPDFRAAAVPSDSIGSRLLDGTAAVQTPVGEGYDTGEGVVRVLRGTDTPDVLYGTENDDVARAGAGGDTVYTGTGDDLVLLDASSADAKVDAGRSGTDVLRILADPLAAPGSPSNTESRFTLVLDANADGTPAHAHAISGTEVVLGPDASGHIEFENGSRVTFAGVERLRF